LTIFINSCSFAHGRSSCEALADYPLSIKTQSNVKNVFESAGSLIVFHGFGCSESNKSGTEEVIRVEEELQMPPYVTDATVFLNGWKFQYINGDHNLAGIGAAIRNIRKERTTVRWEAVGLISDDNFDDGYRMCYRFTVIGWNSAAINLTIDHKDGTCEDTITKYFEAVNRGTTTALATFPTFLRNPVFSSINYLGIIPRGFGYNWNSGDDHNLLQLSYAMGTTAPFLKHNQKYYKSFGDTLLKFPDTASRVGRDFLSWESSTIFKDNSARREYQFGELISGIGGNDIGFIQPPFTILPIEDETGFLSACPGVGGFIDSMEYIIKGIPFQFAIPVLDGWDLGYGSPESGCYDANIKDIGIWIDNWSFNIPGDPAGTLRYKLSAYFGSNDNDPSFYYRHRVSILGIRPILQRNPTGGQLSDFSSLK
jgi:hypothetical protein